MGDRVSIQFVDNDGDKSPVLFHHWGGTYFPKFALAWFRELKGRLKESDRDPITRLEARNIIVQFISYLKNMKELRECVGFEKNKDGEDTIDKPIYSDELLSHSIYMGTDEKDGDNSDNGHYVIYTQKDEMFNDRGEKIEL